MVAVESEVKAFMAELKVVLDGAEHNLRWSSEQSLVAAMIAASLLPPHSCLVGKCGACVCTLVDGLITMDHNDVLDEDDLAENYILGCQAKPLTQNINVTFD